MENIIKLKTTRLKEPVEQVDCDEIQSIEDELVLLEHPLIADEEIPHIDYDDKWCVYLSVHPLGFYYYGKGITKNVLSGTYKGSGTSLRASWVWYPKDEWTASLLETFKEHSLDEHGKDLGETEAYLREREIINFDMLCDPFCLNDVPGGKGGYTWGQVSSRAVEKRKKAVSDSWNNPEMRERHRVGNIARWSTPGAREKHRDIIRHSWTIKRQTDEFVERAERTALIRQQKALTAKLDKKAVRAATKAKAAAAISEKAIARAEKARQKKFQEFSPQFEHWVLDGVYTKSRVLDVKKTVAKHNAKISSVTINHFIAWLDVNDILRWGGESHKKMLLEKVTQKEIAEEERRVELLAKAEKIYKMKASSRDK